MSRLQMQQSKERAAQAKRMQRDRYRPVGMDETFDLTKETPSFVTVPTGVDGCRFNRDTLELEILRGKEVVESIGGDALSFDGRLGAIKASVAPNQKNEFMRQLKAAKEALGKRLSDHDWFQRIKPEVRALREFHGFGLQCPNKSHTRDLLDDLAIGRVASTDDLLAQIRGGFSEAPPMPFMIEHDWAAAFQGADDVADGEIRLPYDGAMFEFRISGMVVLLYTREAAPWIMFIKLSEGWIAGPSVPTSPEAPTNFQHNLDEQIRAICIALDAGVAIRDTVRADEKLNRAREKRGKPPLHDYHVIRLARRDRAAPLPASDDDERKHRSPRLHFVRGHWRHYDAHKTWINWHLRGDPDLGFIDKHYRL